MIVGAIARRKMSQASCVLCLASEDEVGRREKGDHREDVALDGDVSEEVKRIDGSASGGVNELADDRAEDREPGLEPQGS